MADRDYICARMSAFAELMPQFLWSSQQSIEKYLKCILLLNRVPAKSVGHDIQKALALTTQLPFALDLGNATRKFIAHISTFGTDRYFELSPYLLGHVCIELDRAVWELRRYCQVLECDESKLLPWEAEQLRISREALEMSREKPPHKFSLNRGFIETVLADNKHPARGPLLRQNAFFGSRTRRSVRSKSQMQFANSPLLLFPNMIDELVKYVHIPAGTVAAYKTRFASKSNSPSSL